MQTKVHLASDTATAIGVAVRHGRASLGLRQDELAMAAGVSTRAVHQIEHGKPTSRLDSLTAVLGVLGLELRVADRGSADAAPERATT